MKISYLSYIKLFCDKYIASINPILFLPSYSLEGVLDEEKFFILISFNLFFSVFMLGAAWDLSRKSFLAPKS